MSDSIKIFAPATVANVTCGFDVMGFALHEPGDAVTLKRIAGDQLVIESVTGDDGRLPWAVDKNTVSISIASLLKSLDIKTGISIQLDKQMPIGSGLGSSAASAVGGVFAVNKLLDLGLSDHELLVHALKGEEAACGSAHADNVAPSLMGGFTLIRSYDPLDVIKLPVPEALTATVIYPHIEVNTKDARQVLRRMISLRDAIKQWGNVGGLVTGLITSNYDLISRSMVDEVIEPMRSVLIPGFDEVKLAALEAGVLGFGISGSGPSLFALSKNLTDATEAGEAMKLALKTLDIGHDVFISAVNFDGPVILD